MRFASLAVLLLASALPARAADLPRAQSPNRGRYVLTVSVHDETGVAVPSVRVTLVAAGSQTAFHASTDFAGRAAFRGLAADLYFISAEKSGFYAQLKQPVQVDESKSVEVTLPHQQEYKETVQVHYSPPAIDLSRVSSSQQLTAQEIIELPYPSTRDIRNALPLFPQVLPDNSAPGQVHVAGAASNETLYTLDGFDISQPVSGLLDLRLSTDAIRSMEVQTSRYSVADGWSTGGVISLDTGMGDDHFRLYGTDFVPSFQERRGFHLANTTPRFTLSGPLRKGKAWFYEAVEGEYDVNIFTELPPGQDTDHYWRYSTLTSAQFNITQANHLTASYLYNHSSEDHASLSLIQPLSTTTSQVRSADLADVKDQNTWSNGMLLEAGFAFLQFKSDALPLGNEPYIQLPGTASGNYYLTAASTLRRYEGFANLYVPPVQWHGSHQFTVGAAFERTGDHQFALRRPFDIENDAGVLVRSVTFEGSPSFAQELFAGSGFVQDRWTPTSRVLVEPGVRFDEDDLLKRALVSPRVAATWMVTHDDETKLSAGVGLYYDRTDLDRLTRPLSGVRQDVFYAPDGVTPLGPPVTTAFQANPAALRAPGSVNWSVAVERRLPAAIYLKTEFLERRGYDGFEYADEGLTISPNGLPSSGLFTLQNDRRDKYDAATISVRHTFAQHYPLFVSYTYSKARSNAVLDSTLDVPFFSPQLAGPLPWNSPNRVQFWGATPFRLPWIHALELDYAFDWRNGYPYNVVDLEQELVGPPGADRFPDFASLNLHVEKRFHLFGFEWALRAGFNNITDRSDPLIVENNIDAPNFGEFGDFQHRAFTGRIRFLGRK
ncbi:MAG TPA: carboxypeptidase regulatory-like domain-containing protein [Candidatus Acidoferrum sp.]|nr:carboxypeptidase regulatory-like domain-containing protein [Candidatus Acidoferrum sp.]